MALTSFEVKTAAKLQQKEREKREYLLKVCQLSRIYA
jgi:hypothetical protein